MPGTLVILKTMISKQCRMLFHGKNTIQVKAGILIHLDK